MATQIATAYVQILPSMQGIKGNLEKELNDVSEESGKKAGTSSGSAFAKFMGKAILAGAAAVGTSILTIGTQAVKSYAEYEQLVGGVETLFGDSSDQLMEYAANAYKTAGLSANDYMEQSTSFAASLLQGLGGDTAAAVEIADLAISDMADNSNKMGTSMEAIQNAYQGFAKSNYTMLDNLKLGYGGTESEMIRLINDSGILEETISDMDEVSFDQVIEAIHAVQENMGITGTTAAEASTTILGSVGQMKASWSNLLTGMADENADFDTLVQNFSESVLSVGDNLMPRIKSTINGVAALVSGLVTELLPQLIDQIPDLVAGLLPVVLSGLNTIFTSISQMLPDLLSVLFDAIPQILETLPQILQIGMQLIVELANGISQALPTLIPTVVQIVIQLVQTLLENLPTIIEAGLNIVIALVQGIINALPTLIESLPTLIQTIVDTLIASLDVIIEAGVTLLNGIVEAIPEILPVLIEQLPTIIDTIINGLIQSIDALLEAGITLLTAVVDAIPEFLPQLVAAMPQIIMTIINAILNNIPTLLSAAVQMFTAIITAIPQIVMSLISALPQIARTILQSLRETGPQILQTTGQALRNIVNAIPPIAQNLWTSMVSVGTNLIQGLWNGISNAAAWIYSKISGFFSSVLSYIKGLFGISSPSKETAYMGKMLDYGLAGGIEDNMKPIKGAIDDVTDLTTGTLQDDLAVNAALGVSTDAQATSKLDQLISTVAALGNKMESLQIVIDSGALVGATTTKMNQALGFDQALVTRGVAR